MIGGDLLKAFLWRKAQEPTTWIPIVTGAAAYAHFNLPDNIRDLIVNVLLGIVALLFALANESRKPSGGPLGVAKPSPAAGDAPPGSVERVPDSPADLVRTVEAHTAGVEAVSGRDLHSDARPDLPAGVPKPVRPGFDNN